MHIKVRKETTKEGRTPSSPVLFSNLKKKERKMTRQKTTTLHKTPKPRASDTYQKNRKSKTHENENTGIVTSGVTTAVTLPALLLQANVVLSCDLK